jgi:hypothetical protein
LQDDVLDIARIRIRRHQTTSAEPLTSAFLTEEVLKSAQSLAITLDEQELERIVRELEAIFTTWIDRPKTLDDGKHIPWLLSRMTEIEWRY